MTAVPSTRRGLTRDLVDACLTLLASTENAPEHSVRLFRRALLLIAESDRPGLAAEASADLIAEELSRQLADRTEAPQELESPGAVDLT